MRNVSLVISYDGTNYHGWQCQPNAVTIQETLQEGVEKVLNHPVKLYAGARTDAGVHAKGQVVNFFTDRGIELRGLARGLNSLMPSDIRVMGIREVPEDFHARYSAKRKTYVYCIHNETYRSPFFARYALHAPYRLNPGLMKEAVKSLIGEHDFSAFKKKNEAYDSAVRRVIRAGVGRRVGMLYIVLEANGFLRYMVRNIVGTLLLVGQEKIAPAELRNILDSKERERAGPTAPAHGLFLKEITY